LHYGKAVEIILERDVGIKFFMGVFLIPVIEKLASKHRHNNSRLFILDLLAPSPVSPFYRYMVYLESYCYPKKEK
jgi:hypothetical protein